MVGFYASLDGIKTYWIAQWLKYIAVTLYPSWGFPGYVFSYRELHRRFLRGATASTTPKEEVKDAPNGANLETGVEICRTGDPPWFNHIQSIDSIRWSKIVKEHSSWKKEGFPIVSSVFSFFWEYVTSLQLNSRSQTPICVRDFHVFWTPGWIFPFQPFWIIGYFFPSLYQHLGWTDAAKGVNRNPSPVVAE